MGDAIPLLNTRLSTLRDNLPGRALVERLGWATGGYAVTQVLRLGSNIILARLLAPELFGIMVIVNTLRTGFELLSDIGVGQNIVTSRNSDDRDFLNTAWTLQILRGLVLAALFALFAHPLSQLYGGGQVTPVLQVAALLLVTGGAGSIAPFVLQRRQAIPRLATYEVILATAGSLIQIGFALVSPTIWGLLWGVIAGGVFNVVTSYALIPGFKLRFRLKSVYVREIFNFGKWIFLSSLLYFVATNFDRLYLGTAIPLAVLGIYGVARSLSEIFGVVVLRVANLIVFPAVAATQGNRIEVRAKLTRNRHSLLLAAALGIASFIAIADLLIYALYDNRYYLAAHILPLLAAGVWFTILTTMGESVLLGLGRPMYGTAANATKLVWLLIALPLGVHHFGLAGAVLAIALADSIRYLPVMWAQRREGVSFLRHDVAITLLMFGAAILFRELTHLVGLTSGVEGWWTLAREAFA